MPHKAVVHLTFRLSIKNRRNYSAEPQKTSQQGADGLFSGHLSAGSAYIATMDGLSGPVNDSLAPDFRISE